jgi:lysophospholipase L1-like esterase
MSINEDALRILCYGDSNTWGYIPGSGERFSPDIRWTGLLQKNLGNSYEIIEEGLNARTTILDDPKHEGKNGAIYLKPCLQTHYPLNVVILMLGTNDLKERFNRTPQQITEGIEKLVSIIFDIDSNYNHKPKIILMSPPIVDESVNGVKDKYSGAEEKSKQLGELYKSVAEKNNLEFIDLAKYVIPSKTDGYHLEPDVHKKIAELIVEKIRKLYN